MPQFNAIKLEIEVASEIVAGPEILAGDQSILY